MRLLHPARNVSQKLQLNHFEVFKAHIANAFRFTNPVAQHAKTMINELGKNFALPLADEIIFDNSSKHESKWIGSDEIEADCRLVITNVIPGILTICCKSYI